jgi:hypothetical protein
MPDSIRNLSSPAIDRPGMNIDIACAGFSVMNGVRGVVKADYPGFNPAIPGRAPAMPPPPPRCFSNEAPHAASRITLIRRPSCWCKTAGQGVSNGHIAQLGQRQNCFRHTAAQPKRTSRLSINALDVCAGPLYPSQAGSEGLSLPPSREYLIVNSCASLRLRLPKQP